jgi:antitoxin VapB
MLAMSFGRAPVPLTLSNPEADRLARSLAALTGETVEQAVERALRDGLARERERRRAAPPGAGGPGRGGPADDEDRLLQDVRAIARRFREHAAGRPFTALDHGELLYDEAGLPR